MGNTTLLIQPPYGSILEIPFGTLPALTGSLRNKGHNAIQRDFNVEVFLQLLEAENINALCDLARKKIASADDEESSRINGELDSFRRTMPEFEGLRASIEREANDKKFKRETYELANRTYRRYMEIIEMLIAAGPYPKYECIDGPYNLYHPVFDKLFKTIEWDDIGLVGISITREALVAGLTLANMVRKRYPRIHVVMGGPLFTEADLNDGDDIQDLAGILENYAHSVVLYEGDTAIVKIIECLQNKCSWDDVRNLVQLKDDEIKINRPFHFERIEDLPLPDFDGLPVRYYPGLPVEVSRGCYWARCAFCYVFRVREKSYEYSKNVAHYRFFGTDRIVSTFRHLKEKYGKEFFEFTCEDISPNEMRRLCVKMIEARLGIGFGFRVRLDKGFTPDLFDLMAQAGAYYYHLHPETFSEKTALLHNKNYNIPHIKSLVAYWSENRHRLPPLMVNVVTKFPKETFEDFLDTYNYIREQPLYVQGIWGFKFEKNCGVYHYPDRYGIKIIRKKTALFSNVEGVWDEDVDAERRKIANFLREHGDEVRKLTQEWRVKFKTLYA